MRVLSRFPILKLLLPAVALLLLVATPVLAFGGGGQLTAVVQSRHSLDTLYGPAAGDQTTVAVVDGQPVSRRAVRQQQQLLAAEKPGLTSDQARKQAFAIVAKNTAAYVEAKKEGLTVSPQEVTDFLDFQRKLYNQADAKTKLPIDEAIKASGLAPGAYWQSLKPFYAHALLVAKLRQKVFARYPSASRQEKAAHWEHYLDSLFQQAQITYVDKSLQ